MTSEPQDKHIIRRKAPRLGSNLKLTKEEIEEFFLQGLLPAKMITQIEVFYILSQ